MRGGTNNAVLDGTSMSFEAELSDGTYISASGSNKFPSNYGTLTNTLYNMTTRVEITDTHFTNERYEITLPESWVGVVTARFGEGHISFMARNLYSLDAYGNNISEEVQKIADTYEADRQAVIDSFKPVNGYILNAVEE